MARSPFSYQCQWRTVGVAWSGSPVHLLLWRWRYSPKVHNIYDKYSLAVHKLLCQNWILKNKATQNWAFFKAFGNLVFSVASHGEDHVGVGEVQAHLVQWLLCLKKWEMKYFDHDIYFIFDQYRNFTWQCVRPVNSYPATHVHCW